MSNFQSIGDTVSKNRYCVKRFADTPQNYAPHMRVKARSDYGLRLVKAREHAGMTQHALAKAVGMSQSAYAGAETTGQGSSYTSQLAAACGVRAEWLATGAGKMVDNDDQTHAEDEPDVMQAIEVLAGAFSALDKATRLAVAPLLSLLAQEPDQVGNVTSALQKLLPRTNLAQIPQQDRPAGRQISTVLPSLEQKERQGHAKRIPDQARGRT